MAEQNSDWRNMFDRDYIGHFDLQEDVTVTISRVVCKELTNKNGKSKKPILHFEGKDKGYAACKTSCKAIAGMYGNKTKDWVGKKITLFATTCEAFGESNVDCIRVRPTIPKEAAKLRSA